MKLALALSFVAAPALALTPLPPCEGAVEANMVIYGAAALGGYGGTSGVVVEQYGTVTMADANGVFVDVGAPVPELAGFNGARVMDCATGVFFAQPFCDAQDMNTAISATEFVRPDVQAGNMVTLDNLRNAVRALYPDAIELRETEQSCSCAMFFDELRPAGQTPYSDRAN